MEHVLDYVVQFLIAIFSPIITKMIIEWWENRKKRKKKKSSNSSK